MGISRGKWTKHQLMLKDGDFVKYLPDTQLLSEDSFWLFLDNYNQVIVKPSIGSLGRGIIKVTNHGDREYEVHIEHKKIVVNGREKTYKIVCDNLRKKKYIVQEVILLETYHNRPFDIRVMVQRKKNSLKWNVTGKAVKVAANGFFITNVAKEIVTIEEAFRESQLPNNLFSELLTEIEHVSLKTANYLGKYYPKTRKFGIDIGIDDKGKVWIIEVNVNPNIAMFKTLGDEIVLNKIRAFLKG